MADQTLIIRGPAASALCYGLLDTGKFIRLSEASANRTESDGRLFAFWPAKNTDKQDTNKTNRKEPFPQNDNKPKKPENTSKKPKIPPNPFYRDSADIAESMGDDFILRGADSVVNAVLSVLRVHERDFKVSAEELGMVCVDCVGSLSRTEKILKEIQELF